MHEMIKERRNIDTGDKRHDLFSSLIEELDDSDSELTDRELTGLCLYFRVKRYAKAL